MSVIIKKNLNHNFSENALINIKGFNTTVIFAKQTVLRG